MDSLWLDLRYHVWWPGSGDDPMCWANKDMNTTRNNYYENNYTPHMFTNGSDSESNPINWAQTPRSLAGALSPIKIILSGSRTGMDVTLSVSVFSLKDYGNQDLRLFVAAVMDTVQYPDSPNGLPEHHNAVIGMLTADTGQTISLTANTPLENSFDWTVLASWQQATSYAWNVNDLRLVAWIQDYSSQEILQAGDLAF
ncbi:MAG: hypothetical protein ACE5D2_08405 [Fidelibacterota bacterium]